MTLRSLLIRVLLVVLVAPFLTGCDLEDDYPDFHFVNLKVLEVELPESFDVYETYEVKVTYLRPNGCTFFEGFDVTKPDTTIRHIVAVGSEMEDTSCTQATQEVVETFRFTCYYSDTYLFRFWTGEDEEGNPEFLEYEVPVNPDPWQ